MVKGCIEAGVGQLSVSFKDIISGIHNYCARTLVGGFDYYVSIVRKRPNGIPFIFGEIIAFCPKGGQLVGLHSVLGYEVF